MSNENECQELKNIKYKTMLLSGTSTDITPSVGNTDTLNVDILLDKERKLNKKEPWSKLDKTVKIRKLDDYVVRVTEEHGLTTPEALSLKKYLATSLDRKKLQRVKDVIYDKALESIKSIPSLHFNTTTRKFTLKRSDKRVSTLKCLGKGKTRKNNKIDVNIKDK
jgi:hypothetical protein